MTQMLPDWDIFDEIYATADAVSGWFRTTGQYLGTKTNGISRSYRITHRCHKSDVTPKLLDKTQKPVYAEVQKHAQTATITHW